MNRLLYFLGAQLIRALHATLRVRHVRAENIESVRQYIIAFWHAHLLLMLHARYRKPIVVLISQSKDGGATWSPATAVADQLGRPVDRFNHWMAIDASNGEVALSFYDTRNDTTGSRYMTDIYLSRSSDGGTSFGPNVRVSDVSSNEHDCDGVFPCSAINYGNQQGDYSGLVAFGGIAHPFWTDSRRNQRAVAGCRFPALEEVYTARVK